MADPNLVYQQFVGIMPAYEQWEFIHTNLNTAITNVGGIDQFGGETQRGELELTLRRMFPNVPYISQSNQPGETGTERTSSPQQNNSLVLIGLGLVAAKLLKVI